MDFKPIKQVEIIDQSSGLRYPKWIEGYEDCRFCLDLNNDLYFSSVTFHLTPEYLAQISLSKLDNINESESSIGIICSKRIKGPVPGRCEKNWLPFIYKSEICFVYMCDPFTILKPILSDFSNPNSNDMHFDVSYVKSCPYDLSKYRGSAAPIEFDGGFLMIIHDVIFSSNAERTYIHRFVWFDLNSESFPISKISHAWYLKDKGIEFCSGMYMDSGIVYIAAGLKDREAWIFKVTPDTIKNYLFNITDIIV